MSVLKSGIRKKGGPQAAFLVLLVGIFCAGSATAQLQTYGITGDAGLWNGNSQMVVESLLKSQIRSVILPGDNIYDERQSYQQVWEPWLRRGLRFDLVAIGNHTRGYREEVQFFKMPGEFYSKKTQDTLWIVLNSDNEATTVPQIQWFQQTLERATEKFVFVILHHPPYTVTRFHSWTEKRRFLEPFRRVLWANRSKVTALLVGHDHIASFVTLNDVPMIVSGAVQDQRPERPMNYDELGVAVRTQWMFRKNPHWARLDVNSESGEVWVNYVDAKADWVSCSVRVAPRPFIMRDNCKQSRF